MKELAYPHAIRDIVSEYKYKSGTNVNTGFIKMRK